MTVNKHKTWSDGVNEMNKAMKKENIQGTIMEIYSPERTNAIAKMWDLLPGCSLDLTTVDPDDDKPWDFNTQEKRDKAEQIIKYKKVMLLIGSPMCTAFSKLQSLNRNRMSEEKNEK